MGLDERNSAITEEPRYDDDATSSEENPQSSRIQENLELRFLVKSNTAGAVIGKKGEKINKLRQDFNAYISVPDSKGPERVLVIKVPKNSLRDLLDEVIPSIAERAPNAEREVKLLLPNSHAGSVIGKGGAQIKSLREKTHAMIKVFDDFCPNSTERVVEIAGDSQRIVDAAVEIVKHVSQIPLRGEVTLYDPRRFSPSSAVNYGGYGDVTMVDRRGPIFPTRIIRSERYQPYNPLPRSRNIDLFPSSYLPRSNPFNGHPLEVPRLNYPARERDEEGSESLEFSDAEIGAIIGRRGERIREIRQKSGAEIKIERMEAGSKSRVVTVIGTPRERRAARLLLEETAKERPRRR